MHVSTAESEKYIANYMRISIFVLFKNQDFDEKKSSRIFFPTKSCFFPKTLKRNETSLKKNPDFFKILETFDLLIFGELAPPDSW